MRWLFSLFLLGLVGAVHSLSSSGMRVLVVQEDPSEKELFSSFWKDLESRGYTLDFESPKNEQLVLFQHGIRAYDHIILLPPKSKGFGPSLTPKTLLDFINSEGNVLLALSSASPVPTAINSLLLELDINLSSGRSSIVVDHFNYDTISASEQHDVLLLPRPPSLRPDVKPYFSGDGILAFPRTSGQILGNASPLLAPILRAPPTAYSYNVKDDSQIAEDSVVTGSQISLVSTMQARNSARFTVLGSVESLEDKWFSATVKGPNDGKQTKTVNREFAKQVTAWTFREVGVIKVGRLQHYLVEEGVKRDPVSHSGEANPTIYRVKTDVAFSIELSEYDYDKFIPFEPPGNDALQLEFTMLSPFHRLTLKPSAATHNSTIYSTSFTLPDQHGIFSFRVNYKRPFLTNVDEKQEVTVRHFAHDEWPRSWKISGGWVWIAGLWSVIGGFLAFLFLWLYSAPSVAVKKVDKVQ